MEYISSIIIQNECGSSTIPKQMTLNDLEWPFCVKICFGLGNYNGLASPAFGQNCSKTCRATHILSATKMQPRERSFWQYKVYANIRGGSLERGRQMRVGQQKMLLLGFGFMLLSDLQIPKTFPFLNRSFVNFGDLVTVFLIFVRCRILKSSPES